MTEMMVTVAAPPNAATYEKQASRAAFVAKRLTVEDDASNDRALAMLRKATELEAAVKAEFEPIVRSTRAAHDAALAMQRKYLLPVQEVARVLRGKVSAYVTSKQRAVAAARQVEDQAPQLALAPPKAEPVVEVKTEGASFAAHWSVTVTDPLAVLGEVISGRLPIECVEIKLNIVRAMVRAKNADPGIAGIKCERELRARIAK